MGVAVATEQEVNVRCIRSLGLDPLAVDLSAPEAIAGALRRAASFLCPTTAGRLISAVENTLVGLVDTRDGLRELIAEVLVAVVGYGDLLELLAGPDDVKGTRTELYLAPPGFVCRKSGSFLMFGVRPEASPLVGEELMPLVQSERHVRSIPATANTDVRALLTEYGLHELTENTWLNAPRAASAEDVRKRFDTLLSRAGPSGSIEGLSILDPSRPVHFYNGRWRNIRAGDTGNFVARRPQAYGAHIWCYAKLSAGLLTNAIDLPTEGDGLSRGCDIAWYLQAAIDAIALHPQMLRLRRPHGHARATLELFSPPPSWLQRRWDALGTPVSARGALMAYAFDEREVVEEADYARRMLWLTLVEEA